MGATHLHPRLALAAVSLVALSLLVAAAPATAAPTPPTCQVTMNDAQVVAKPTTSQSDRIVLQGTVEVNLGSLSGSRPVTIEALMNVGEWSVSIDPPTSDVTGAETIPVNATLVVPAMTESSVSGSLTVVASFLAAPGFPSSEVSCSDSVTVSVQQYYGLTADTAHSQLKVKTGAEGILASVILHNLGNGVDYFVIDLTDSVGFQQMGIHAGLPTRVRMEPDAETNATFAINASSDVREDSYPLTVTVRSEGKPTTAFTTVSFTLEVDNVELLSSLPDPSTLIILAGIAAAGIGGLLVTRRVKRKRAARAAEARLKRIVRQRREAEGPGAEYADDTAAALEVENVPETPAPPERVRVRVKAPPKT